MIPEPPATKESGISFSHETAKQSHLTHRTAPSHLRQSTIHRNFLSVRCRTRFLFFFSSERFAALVNLIPFDIVLQTSAILTMRLVTLLPSVISAKSFVKRRGKKKKKKRHSLRLFSKGRSRRIDNSRYNDSKRATGCFPLENMSLCRREIFEL